jgi:hypothetical protein
MNRYSVYMKELYVDYDCNLDTNNYHDTDSESAVISDTGSSKNILVNSKCPPVLTSCGWPSANKRQVTL